MVAHPWSASGGLCLILKFWLDRSYSFGESAIFDILAFWLETAFSCSLLRDFGGTFSPNDVIYHCNSQKAPPCAETRRLCHKAWNSVQQFDLGACPRIKRTGQDSLKSHKGVIFHLLGRSHNRNDLHQNLHGGCCPVSYTHLTLPTKRIV